MDDAEQFLQYAGVTISFYKDNSASPYLMGAGFWDAYRVTLTNKTGEQGQVIALVDNDKPQVKSLHILTRLGLVLHEFPAGIESFQQWTHFVLTEDAQSFDAGVIHEGNALDDSYLHTRYQYLARTRRVLTKIFAPESLALLTEFLYRYVMHEWPWLNEKGQKRKDTPNE